MLVAPSEPARLCASGTVSLIAESYGADILWGGQAGLVGVQRKVFPGDFLASVNDGRLSKEFAQMQQLHIPVLLLEGRGTWTTDGVLVYDWGRTTWTRSAHRRYLYSVRARGVWVEWSDSLDDTIALLADLREWSAKDHHHATTTRPGPRGDGWGRVTDRDFQIHAVQSVPGVGPELAARIVDTIGCPLMLRVGVEELMTVPGIGKAKARRIVRAFKGEETT